MGGHTTCRPTGQNSGSRLNPRMYDQLHFHVGAKKSVREQMVFQQMGLGPLSIHTQMNETGSLAHVT